MTTKKYNELTTNELASGLEFFTTDEMARCEFLGATYFCEDNETMMAITEKKIAKEDKMLIALLKMAEALGEAVNHTNDVEILKELSSINSKLNKIADRL